LSGSRLSKRYAKALFSLGQEDGNFDQYGRDLIEFAGFCQQQEDFRRVIANPVFAVEDRKRILQSVLEKSSFSDMVKNFLYLLLEKDRMGAIESITEYYVKLTDVISNIARAEIITARPLKEESLARIERSLERLTSKKIRSEVKEDQELIGGVVVKIGDMVLDGSVKAQIEGLKESF
jgi:F-type H+-transporting ATPase subunit delta